MVVAYCVMGNYQIRWLFLNDFSRMDRRDSHSTDTDLFAPFCLSELLRMNDGGVARRFVYSSLHFLFLGHGD